MGNDTTPKPALQLEILRLCYNIAMFLSTPNTHSFPPKPMQQVNLAGNLVYYRHAGNSPPLILLHGWGGSSRYWQTTMERLAPIRSIYAPDLPGFGASPPLSDVASGQRLAALVIDFADALGLEQFDLNGHSFCAGVAVYIASRWPQRVRKLVLTCFSTFRNERERLIVDQIHRLMSLWLALRQPWMGRLRPFYRAIASRFFYRVPADDALLRENFIDFLRMDKRTALESAASAGSPAITTALRAVAAPTLLIGARQDTIMPSPGVPEVARLVPNCRLVWIERCGHLPMIERPAIYHRLLHEFLV
jgi:pimeloyl-ACP methyl ester carboxylesterase